MQVLDGKHVSEFVRSQLKTQIDQFKSKFQRSPHLVVILVGEDKASQIYVRNKHLACEKIGMKSTVLNFPASLTQQALIQEVQRLNQDADVDGILVQMPLPSGIDSFKVLESIDPSKDADGLTSAQMGRLFIGKGETKPCTPAGVIEILKYYKIPMSGKKAVVVGRSQIVGRPMAQLLIEEDATVTVTHSRTHNVSEFTSQADIVVVAAGKPGILGPQAFKKGAVVVDVGIHRTGADQKTIVGDVAVEANGVKIQDVASAMTPVPGGVGPMTITMLLKNTVKLAQLRADLRAK